MEISNTNPLIAGRAPHTHLKTRIWEAEEEADGFKTSLVYTAGLLELYSEMLIQTVNILLFYKRVLL